MSPQVAIVCGPLTQHADGWLAAGAGAIVVFEGVVRPAENGQAITGLDYEVYEPMAQRILEQIAAELAARFDLLGVRVEHSRGFVPAGACSFRLRVAAEHRSEALAAAAEFIDRMKRDAPIWKTPVPKAHSSA